MPQDLRGQGPAVERPAHRPYRLAAGPGPRCPPESRRPEAGPALLARPAHPRASKEALRAGRRDGEPPERRRPDALPSALSPADPARRGAAGGAERQPLRLRQPDDRGPRQGGSRLEGAPHPRRGPVEDRAGIDDRRPARSAAPRPAAARRHHPGPGRRGARHSRLETQAAGGRRRRPHRTRADVAALQPADTRCPPFQADPAAGGRGTGGRVALPFKAARREEGGRRARERVLARRAGRPAARGAAAVRNPAPAGHGRVRADPRGAPVGRGPGPGRPAHAGLRAPVSGRPRRAPAGTARSARRSRRSRVSTRGGCTASGAAR